MTRNELEMIKQTILDVVETYVNVNNKDTSVMSAIGVVQGKGTKTGNKVKINGGAIYDNVKSVGNIIFKKDSVVYLFVPNGQYSNMFILGQLDDTPANIVGGTININDRFVVDEQGNVRLGSNASNPSGGDKDNGNIIDISYYEDEEGNVKTYINGVFAEKKKVNRAVDNYYIQTDSATTVPSLDDESKWSTKVPSYNPNKYIWSSTWSWNADTVEGDPPSVKNTPVCLGNGIKSVEEYYFLSSSATELVDATKNKDGWVTTQPKYEVGTYYWSKNIITWTNGTTTETTPVLAGAISDVYDKSKDYTDDTVDEYDTSLNQDKVFNKLTNGRKNQGIYLDGEGETKTLYINAEYIATGKLTDVNGKNYWDLDKGIIHLDNSNTYIDEDNGDSTTIGNYIDVTTNQLMMKYSKKFIPVLLFPATDEYPFNDTNDMNTDSVFPIGGNGYTTIADLTINDEQLRSDMSKTYTTPKYVHDNYLSQDDAKQNYTKLQTYNSFIEQLPNQIEQQVSASYVKDGELEPYVKKAEIIVGINNETQSSEVKINADKININGIASIGNKFVVDSKTGAMTATDGTFTGTITAIAGNIGGIIIGDANKTNQNGIWSNGYTEKTNTVAGKGFKIDKDGNAHFYNATVEGTITATDGSVGDWLINTGLYNDNVKMGFIPYNNVDDSIFSAVLYGGLTYQEANQYLHEWSSVTPNTKLKNADLFITNDGTIRISNYLIVGDATEQTKILPKSAYFIDDETHTSMGLSPYSLYFSNYSVAVSWPKNYANFYYDTTNSFLCAGYNMNSDNPVYGEGRLVLAVDVQGGDRTGHTVSIGWDGHQLIFYVDNAPVRTL